MNIKAIAAEITKAVGMDASGMISLASKTAHIKFCSMSLNAKEIHQACKAAKEWMATNYPGCKVRTDSHRGYKIWRSEYGSLLGGVCWSIEVTPEMESRLLRGLSC